MFTSRSVKTIRKHLNRHNLSVVKYRGASRRAISLMPAPQSSGSNVLTDNKGLDWNRLSLAIEASQKSGCLLIESEKNKSRSAMLIFRGRILSCMYGNKGLGKYLFGDQAFESAVQDLKNVSKKVQAYALPDHLVMSAAALFHGAILPIDEAFNVKQAVDSALAQLVESNLPGCIVITGQKDSSVCIVYVFARKIVGLHCSKRGWLEATQKEIYRYLSRHKDVVVQASMLPCQNVVEVLRHTFSPTGLDTSNWQPLSPTFPVPNVFYLRRLDELQLRLATNVVQIDRFFPQRSSNGADLFKRLYHMASLNRAYAICP